MKLYFEPECPHEVLVSRSRVADFLKWVDGYRDIRIGTSLCISNELEAETGTITFRDGALICVESHD